MHLESIDELSIEFCKGAKKALSIKGIPDNKESKALIKNKILTYAKEFTYNSHTYLEVLHNYDDVLIFNILFDYNSYLEVVIYYKNHSFIWNVTKHA